MTDASDERSVNTRSLLLSSRMINAKVPFGGPILAAAASLLNGLDGGFVAEPLCPLVERNINKAR